MANWARLQEKLTGKRVVKRAKHGIHFDNGDGSITADFSGKPCHYQDTDGLWKPIDTGLLLAGDGWYGSPHSDVKIHKDGRVKVGGYQQKSTLVNAKEGVVDGDKIVREFKFGTQYLYMTENGFRQETVIDRTPTTAEAKYLIASESGTLDSKYKRSDITAVDADGDVHEFINLGQFKKWLEGAVYPVVIDPDFAGGTNDIRLTGRQDSNFSTTRAVSTTSSYTETTYSILCSLISGNYYIYRPHLLFDTSSIEDGNTISQVNLKLYATKKVTTGGNIDILIVKNDWSQLAGDITNETYRETAYDGALTADLDDNIWKNSADVTINNQYASGNLSTAWVSKTGTTYYGLLTDTDRDNVAPTGNSYVMVASANHATESYRPVLTVTYTTGSTGVPKHFLHYARLRSN